MISLKNPFSKAYKNDVKNKLCIFIGRNLDKTHLCAVLRMAKPNLQKKILRMTRRRNKKMRQAFQRSSALINLYTYIVLTHSDLFFRISIRKLLLCKRSNMWKQFMFIIQFYNQNIDIKIQIRKLLINCWKLSEIAKACGVKKCLKKSQQIYKLPSFLSLFIIKIIILRIVIFRMKFQTLVHIDIIGTFTSVRTCVQSSIIESKSFTMC